MESNELKYWVAFNAIHGIGRARFNQLEKNFPSLREAWQAGADDLRRAGLDKNAIKIIEEGRKNISPDDEMVRLDQLGIKALTYNDAGYPARLKEIYDYPPVIFINGSFAIADEWCLAVVGTRRPTIYGRQVTEEIVAALAKNKITIVSGLARGIDTIAHQSALASGGRTIAVMAGGLDAIYPVENSRLARDIIKNGALVSEYNPGVSPRPENFPRRNRILSGLSLGVLVIEAPESSGALITARLALEQNREVFAIPGSILSPNSRGTNIFIRNGWAKLVTDYTDILEELNLTAAAEQLEIKELLPENEIESVLLKNLSAESVHIDEICRACGLPIATVSSTLAMMELKGLVKQTGSMNYSLAREAREGYRVTVD